MKKAKATSKGTSRKPAKKRSRKGKKPVDLAEVRKDITRIVGAEATGMAHAVVDEALKGQLAPVKYLFEVSGLYPATPATEARPEEDSLAHTLLKRLGLPTEPVISHDDDIPVKPVGEVPKTAGDETAESDLAETHPEKENVENEVAVEDKVQDTVPVVS